MKISLEQKTVSAMIRIYCRALHASDGRSLCAGCAGLEAYAHARLAKCPFREEKPACVNCPVHCYSKATRGMIREVMRFAGPRMILRHPVLAAAHLWGKIRHAEGRKTNTPQPSQRRP